MVVMVTVGVVVMVVMLVTQWFLLQVNAKGSTLISEIVGAIKMKVQLSGMPELRLGLNDKILFENTGSKLHNRK